MSNLFSEINNNLKEAMRSKSELDLSVLRMLITAIKNKKIELKQSEDLSDDQILDVVKSEVKKRKDSITSYKQGGREDLAEIEENEIKVLEKYMPEQMSDDDLLAIVEEVVASIDGATMQDFGRIMGQAMGRVKGQADGDRVSATVKSVLNK